MTTTEINPVHTIGQASINSQELFKFLEKSQVGQIITYSELTDAAKIDVQAFPTHLMTARRSMIKVHKAAFGTVRGIGIKRLSDEEIPDEAQSSIKRIRKAAKKGINTLGCADISKLSDESKIRLITTKTVLGFMVGAGSRKTINLAEQSARVSNGEMKIGDVSSLFAK